MKMLRWFTESTSDEENRRVVRRRCCPMDDAVRNLEKLPLDVLLSAIISQYVGATGICTLAVCSPQWRGEHFHPFPAIVYVIDLCVSFNKFSCSFPDACLENDALWANLCAERWRGTSLARERLGPQGEPNPLFAPWSVCRCSQTNINRVDVVFLELALPSAFCALAQPGP